MKKDSVWGTIIVAFILCVLCSVIVSSAAVLLKPMQEANKILDIKKNLLMASGLIKDAKARREVILETYEKVTPVLVNFETGEPDNSLKAQEFDQRKAATSVQIPTDKDLAGIKRRSKRGLVYQVFDGEELQMIILPVHGKGLWSTMYGFLALSSDLTEIKGFGIYEHGETPGLGGEVDNPRWKAQWVGKKAFGEDMNPQFKVAKGAVDPNNSQIEYLVDGLSGATITSHGVTGMVQYWLGDHAYGPYLKKLQEQAGKGKAVE